MEACGNEFEEKLDQQPADYVYDGKVRRILTTPSSYAYLKIAEGCDHILFFLRHPLDARQITAAAPSVRFVKRRDRSPRRGSRSWS